VIFYAQSFDHRCRPTVLLDRDKSLKAFTYVREAVLCSINMVVSQRTVLFYISLKKMLCTEGIRRTFINKECVEKVKMASQQMPSASRLFLDLASALRVCFLPFKGLYGVYQRIEG